MRLRVSMLAVVAAAALTHACGVLLNEPALRHGGYIAALAGLCGYALVAGRDARPLVRWPLVTALVVLDLLAAGDAVSVRHELAPGANASVPAQLGGGLWQASRSLLLYGCVAAVVIALPPRRRPALGLVSASGAVLVLLYSGYFLWAATGNRPAVAVAPLLVVSLALLAAVTAGQRAGSAGLAGLGVVTMMLPTLLLFGPAAAAGVSLAIDYDLYRATTGIELAVAVGTATPGLAVLPAVLTAVFQAGLAVVVVGCLRADPTG